MALEEILNGDTVEIETTDVNLEPITTSPKALVFIKNSAGVNWVKDDDGNDRQVISVSGIWGYHDNYASAWVDSLDTVENNPLTSNATTMLVNDADGLAGDLDLVRFQAGQILKITDGTLYEFVFVVATNTTTNELTLLRGQRGTTALAWTQNTPIYIWRVMSNVAMATIEICRLEYRRKDFDHLDAKQILGTGIRVTPETLPTFVKDLLPQPRSFM